MKWQLYIFTALVLLFLAFSASIYTREDVNGASPVAGSGKLVWQKHNCQSCHQLYGLGGYLGPDLTNVISQVKDPNLCLRWYDPVSGRCPLSLSLHKKSICCWNFLPRLTGAAAQIRVILR